MKWSDTQNELEFILNMGPVVAFKFNAFPGLPVEYISNNIIQFGYPEEEFTKYHYNFENIIYLDDVERVRRKLAKSVEAGAYGFTIIYRIYTKFGPVRWIEQRTFIIRDDVGNAKYFQGLFFDVTDRKKVEEEMELNIERQEVLLNLKKIGGRPFQEIIDYAREESVRLTKSKIGYIAFPTPDENTLIMHSWSKNSVRDCSIDEKSRPQVYPVHRTGLWGEAIRQRKPLIVNDYKFPSSLKKGFPSGHLNLYRYMHVPIFDGERIVIVIGVGNKEAEYNDSDILHLTLLMQELWDLLQKKRLEESLKERSAELSSHYEKLRSVSMVSQEFLKDIQHYEDAPQDSVKYLKLMEDEVFLMSYEQQQSVIEEGLLLANRMKHLADSMLYLSMGSRSSNSDEFRKVHFRNLFEHVTLNTILLLRNKDVILETNLPETFPDVIGDEEKLEIVFTTLIENACLNSPTGSKIILEGKVCGGFLEFKVIDFGKDLDESSLPYLFQSITFVGSGHFHTNNLEGAESGLYVAKTILQDHNGKIRGERNPEGGSVFVVKLPLADDEQKINEEA
jgi:PAS domain S-box